jgi:putative serine protease PepD
MEDSPLPPPRPRAVPAAPPVPPAWAYAEAQAPGASAGTRRRRRWWPIAAGTVVLVAVAGVAGGVIGASIAGTRSSTTDATSTPLQVNNQPLPPAGQGSSAAVAAALSPSVGTLVVTLSGGTALGSGFVVSNVGSISYLVTNNHVVSGATIVELIMPTDRTYPATVVGTDPFDDLAVISVQDGHLPAATFGDSTKLVTGQAVTAIGSPLGNAGSVTTGVISAVHRTIQAGDQSSALSETLQDVLQTDAAINPGNSGGPLADAAGRVVGVNVATSGSATNIGFSIPSAIAQRVVTALINHQSVTPPFIGVGYTDPVQAATNGQPYTTPGLMITSVQPGSPAATAGLRQGDVITSIEGQAVGNGETLGGLIQAHKVGDTITIGYIRGGVTSTAKVTLVARPASAG